MRLIVLDRDTVDSMRFVVLKWRKCGGNALTERRERLLVLLCIS